MVVLMPRKVKHRKWHKGTPSGVENRATKLDFGSYGLKAFSSARVTSRQIEAARRTIIRYLKKGGRLWIRIFPDRPVTKKGTEVPMGGGKGSVDHYAFFVRPGRMIFELEGIPEKEAKEALEMAGDKLPLKVKFVKK